MGTKMARAREMLILWRRLLGVFLHFSFLCTELMRQMIIRRLLSTYTLQCNGEFSRAEKESLRGWLDKEKSKGGEALSERLGLSVEELRGLREHC